jgi:aryl carrier-like protein
LRYYETLASNLVLDMLILLGLDLVISMLITETWRRIGSELYVDSCARTVYHPTRLCPMLNMLANLS